MQQGPINQTLKTSLVSPNELAARWSCSRSTVDRIARRAGFSRVLLGSGKNGLLRYRLNEVEAYERERTVQAAQS